MTATLIEARDAMYTLVKAAWPTAYQILWDDLAALPPTTPSPWARTTITFSSGGQASLNNDQGAARYVREGFITIQIFTPVGEGLDSNIALGQLMLDAFDGKATSNGVWFRNANYSPIGNSGDFYQANVLVNFIFDEVK